MALVRKALFGCLVVLVACGALAVLRAVAGLVRSAGEPIGMQDLLVDVSPFPDEWELCIGPTQQPPRVNPERGSREFWFVGFCPTGSERFEQGIDGAEHAVYRYGNVLEATVLFYAAFVQEDFSQRHTVSPWAVPAGWTYTSQFADRFRFACAEVEPFDLGRTVTHCTAVAQYSEYLSVFTTSVDQSYITWHEMERILLAIDERMARYLGHGMQ